MTESGLWDDGNSLYLAFLLVEVGIAFNAKCDSFPSKPLLSLLEFCLSYSL
jgi:hypothetical protein